MLNAKLFFKSILGYLKYRSQASPRKLEDMSKLEFSISAPLVASDELCKLLPITEEEYKNSIGYLSKDPRAWFIYGCLDEVTKVSTASLRWEEFLKSKPKEEEKFGANQNPSKDRIMRGTVESVLDEQQLWARKLNEVFTVLIMFEGTNQSEYYRLYLAFTYLNQFMKYNKDNEAFYSCRNANLDYSISEAKKFISAKLDELKTNSLWFKKPGPNFEMATSKDQYFEACRRANLTQKMGLGLSYEKGFLGPSRSIHVNIGVLKNKIETNQVEENLHKLSFFSMHIISQCYKLLSIEPQKMSKIIHDAVNDPSNAKVASEVLAPDINIGDIVWVDGKNICLVIGRKESEFGYVSFKVHYLFEPLLPGLEEEYYPASFLNRFVPKSVLTSLMKDHFKSMGLDSDLVERIPQQDFLNKIIEITKKMDRNMFVKSFGIRLN